MDMAFTLSEHGNGLDWNIVMNMYYYQAEYYYSRLKKLLEEKQKN